MDVELPDTRDTFINTIPWIPTRASKLFLCAM